jgi:uncharacterized protein involved in type VI secretion and phage assembly
MPEKTGQLGSEISDEKSGRMAGRGPKPVLQTPADCRIRIAGKEIKHLVSRVELGQSVDNHHDLKVVIKQIGTSSAEVDFDDPSAHAAHLGESIALTITPTGGVVDSSKELSFIGIVTEVTIDNSIDGLNRVIISAHSPTVALDGAKQNALFHDQAASDIIGSILRGYPITLGNIESTSGTLRFSVQYRESDYDYVMRLASAAGKFAFYDGNEFRVCAANAADSEDLTWRRTLGAFSVGVGTAPKEHKSDVYNYEQKKTYSHDSTSITQQASLSDLERLSPEASSKIYKNPGFIEAPAVEDARSLDTILEAERNRSMGRMMVCKGQSIMPTVAVGHCVNIREMADVVNRPYWVKAATHVFDESGKYHNVFECVPLDLAFVELRSALSPVTQLQPAVVVDNNDTDGIGRIKVKFPWSGSSETPWVRYLEMHAGKERGAFCLPEIGDEVLVGFELGMADRPIVLGSLYNKDDAPHSKTASSENMVKAFITKGGNEILINDESGKEEIRITTKDGENQVVLSMDGPKLSITGSGDVSIKGKNISIESEEKITIESGTELEAKAGADMTLESSANLKSKASGTYDAEGASVNVKGNPIKLN